MACFADRRWLLLAPAFVATLWTALAAVFTCVDALPHNDAEVRAIAGIAQRWGVEPALVQVEWTEPLPPNTAGEVTLRGPGAQGSWLVDVRTADGTVQRGRLRAGVVQRAARAARDLPRGVTITAADLAWADTLVWGPPLREDAADLEGWTTRRVITAGERLAPPAVAPPIWVRAGDDVRLIVVRGSLELVMPARAAGSGAAGERVAVRASTGRRLTGTITGPGVVRVDAGKDL